MQNGVFLAITMPVADAYGDICAQNDSSPTLCEAPEDRGVGYFYFIFRCSCLQGFNPYPMVIGKLPANLAWVQLAGRCSYGKVGVYVGLKQGRPGHTQVCRCLESWQKPSDGCAPEGSCPRCATSLIAMLQ